jgi:hypothetical protein
MTHLLVIALAATTLAAADVTGTWRGTFTPDGRDAGPALLILKQEGNAVTGTAGPDENEQHPISKGKVENDTVAFDVETPGGVMKFTLKQKGDELGGDVTRERDGQRETAKLAVKRTP